MEKNDFGKKLLKAGGVIAHILEIVMALFVLFAIGVQLVRVCKEMYFFVVDAESHKFLEMLANILVIVVGIEFFALLCKPSVSRVFEVIVFVLARHMILYETSALEDLLVVISIVIVGLVSIWIKNPTHFFKRKKDMPVEEIREELKGDDELGD